MKLLLVTLLLAAVALAQEKYDSSSDNFDVSELLHNERLLRSYSKCLLNKGPCTPEVKKVKETLPEALETRCAKCTERQKQMGKQLAQELVKSHPEIWNELIAYYDPQGKHRQAFQDYLQP